MGRIEQIDVDRFKLEYIMIPKLYWREICCLINSSLPLFCDDSFHNMQTPLIRRNMEGVGEIQHTEVTGAAIRHTEDHLQAFKDISN